MTPEIQALADALAAHDAAQFNIRNSAVRRDRETAHAAFAALCAICKPMGWENGSISDFALRRLLAAKDVEIAELRASNEYLRGLVVPHPTAAVIYTAEPAS